jgi:hypothetical protein
MMVILENHLDALVRRHSPFPPGAFPILAKNLLALVPYQP